MMNKAGVLIAITLWLCACDNEAKRLAQHEKVCLKALEHGLLETADRECTSALGEPGSDALDRATRSQRLFRLGSIKRQRNLFAEAEALIHQSLAIEQGLPEPDPLVITRCHYELSLSLAGQGKWQEGAVSLETLFPDLGRFSDKEQKAIVNMTRLYVANLKNNNLDELAEKIETRLQAMTLSDHQAQN